MSDDQSGVVTLKVRVTPEFREKIVETAKANNRSMNQEIIHRLEQSFSYDKLEVDYLGLTPIEVAHIIPLKGHDQPVVNDLHERRRLAKAAAENALSEMPAEEFFKVVFQKLNARGLSLTIDEVKKAEEANNKKAP